MWCPKFRLRIELEIITYLKTKGEVENGLLSRFPSAGGIDRVWNFASLSPRLERFSFLGNCGAASLCLEMIHEKYHLLTESEVITGKSQTEALMC